MKIWRRSITSFGCALAMLVPALASAEITLSPEVSTRARFDSNPRLQADSPTSVFVSLSEARLQTEFSRPTFTASLFPRVRVSRYTEETELNSEDYFVTANAIKFFEGHQLSSEFRYEREASITTERTDSEIFNVNLPRTTFALNGGWSYAPTDALNFSLSGNALDVSFEEDPRSTFIDYTQFGSSAGLRFAISNRTTLLGNVSASMFKTPQTSSKTASYAFQVGFEQQVYETLYATFRIGNNFSVIDFKTAQTQLISVNPLRFGTQIVDESLRSSGEIIDLFVESQRERSYFRLEWHRSFSPSSQGARQRSQQVFGMARYRITEFIDAEFQVSYRERTQEAQTEVRRLGDLETVRLGARVFYRISPEIRAEFGLRYLEQNRLNTGTKSDSQRVFVAIRYRPQELRFANGIGF